LSYTRTSQGPSWSGQTDAAGHYSADLFSGTHRLAVSGGTLGGTSVSFGEPVNLADDGVHDITVPTSMLSVSVRELSGAPVTNAALSLTGSIATSTLTGSASIEVNLDGDGNAGIPLVTGSVFPHGGLLVFPTGLKVPFPTPPIDGDRRLFLLFDRATGGVFVDDKAPQVTGVPSRPAAAGWFGAPVTISWISRDPRPSSGTPSQPPAITVSAEGANQTVTSAQSCDPAGNCATGTYVVSIDLTPPTISARPLPAPDSHGWYNTPVTVSFDCADALSGVAACADVVLDADGTGQTATGTALDVAGNTATTTIHGINVDRTVPAVTVSGVIEGHSYPLGAQPTPSCTTTDALSGVAVPATVTVTRDAAGQYTASCAGAADVAGNHADPALVGYTVTPTPATLGTLTDAYVLHSGSPNADGVSHDLANKLAHGQYCNYIDTVNREPGGSHPALTTTQAAELVYWARILDPTC
ncbi:MAG: hypothetical protein JWO79_3296, partial [Actinomycetia bacterium]|nr:hypothetical protein [Actinomycetes bacterium]